MAWAALSLMWSSDPASGALQLHKLAVVFVLFCAARAWGRDWPLQALAVISAVLILILVFMVPMAGFGNENFITDYLLMLMPFLAAFMWQNHKKWNWFCVYPFLAVAVYLVVFNDARAEYLVAGTAVVAFWLMIRWYSMALIAALSGLAALLLWPEVFQESLFARLELGLATAAMWLDSPIWGQGFGAFSFEYPRFGETWRVFTDHSSFIGPNEFAGAAHNETLQVMAELGLVGLALAGTFLWLCLRNAQNTPALWCVGTVAVLSLIGFPFQTPATAALGAVALGVAAGPIREPIRLPRLAVAPLVACLIGTVYLGSLEWRGHVAYGQAAMVMKSDSLKAFRANLRAYEIYPWDWQIRHQLYRTFAILASRHTVRVGAGAMERIYTISASAAPLQPYVERKP